jgi:phosphatidylglycerophosphate synthase
MSAVLVMSRWFLASAPNVLSSLRLGLAAAFPFMDEGYRAAAVLASAATDVLDGYLARRLHLTSWQGGLLDAAADKAFVLSALFTLAGAGALTYLQAGALLVRDVTVLLIAAFGAVTRQWAVFRRVPARPWGKAATAGIYLFMAGTLLLPGAPTPRATLYFVAAAAALFAAFDYGRLFADELKKQRAATRNA